jgi:hypothetical protein
MLNTKAERTQSIDYQCFVSFLPLCLILFFHLKGMKRHYLFEAYFLDKKITNNLKVISTPNVFLQNPIIRLS